jgi:DGQHR domain-containing protein
VLQGETVLYIFSASAKTLWSLVQINERVADKDEGYQRALSPARARQIARYIQSGNTIPTSVLVSFGTDAKIDATGRVLTIKNSPSAGWVIDGQHRLAGAHQSAKDIELPVVAFLNLDSAQQIEQFITINREAKGVPTSLYYDLLKHLPPTRSAAEQAKERAADLASSLRRDEDSPFFGRIVVTTSPKRGEISLNNFVRKIGPLVASGKPLFDYTATEQEAILKNYYLGLRQVFPTKLGTDSIFFQTIGFGALINALPTALNLCIKHYKGFRVADVAKLFGEIKHFDFGNWSQGGTGSAAEIMAGDDLKQEMKDAFADPSGSSGTVLQLS